MVTIAVIVDVIAVVAFAIAGRIHHAEGTDAAGILDTAWPFLVGLAAGWITVLKAHENANPLSIVPAGLTLWAWVMVGGVVIRFLTGAGTAFAFVATATLVTGALLVGWRAIVQLVLRFRGTARSS